MGRMETFSGGEEERRGAPSPPKGMQSLVSQDLAQIPGTRTNPGNIPASWGLSALIIHAWHFLFNHLAIIWFISSVFIS